MKSSNANANPWLRSCLRWMPPAGALLFIAAVTSFGAALGGYSQSQHPVALLGARGLPSAMWFDLLGFVLPGTLAACAALALRATLPKHAPVASRLGAHTLLLAALAFAAMGGFPLQLDPDASLNLDASRLHGVFWLLWLVALALSLLLSGIGARKSDGRHAGIAIAMLVGILLFALLLPVQLLAPGISQRIVYALWWLWLVFAGFAGARRAVLR